MSDPLRPRDPLRRRDRVPGEYTDSELPLDAELPKEEYDEVEEVVGTNEGLDDDLDDGLADDETDVEVVEIVDDRTYPDDPTYPPRRDTTP